MSDSDFSLIPRRRRAPIAAAAAVVLAAFGALSLPTSAAAAAAEPPTALLGYATAADLRWQPALDYDTEGCYNVPAIGLDAKPAEGLDNDNTTPSEDCRDQKDLDNTNAYSRQRCNSGWCVYLYDYYFEKDVSVSHVSDPGGHRHDWEHIAVWVQGDEAKYVSVSKHGKYEVKPAAEVQWEGDHPKVVYHKDKGLTHTFRFASTADEPPANHYRNWRLSTLVSYNGFPDYDGSDSEIRKALFAVDFGKASIAIKNGSFDGNLAGAMPLDSRNECVATPRGPICGPIYTPKFAFDYGRDESSPGTPTLPTPPVDPPVDPPSTSPLRVMVVGDSMSQGDEGDFTWRYRLWEWFKGQGIRVEFVGPDKGTVPADVPAAPARPRLQHEPLGPPTLTRTSGEYATEVASDFDSDHYALWGRQAAEAKILIREQVRAHNPDLLLVGLGFNDLGWSVSTPEGTIASMSALVAEARAAKPDLKFALANVPQRTLLDVNPGLPGNTDRYNAALKSAIPTWSTSISPVEHVDWRGTYTCEVLICPSGYDGLHPNVRGEYEIAEAFERTLVDRFKIGRTVTTAPANLPVRPTPVPGNVVARSAPSGIVVTWDKVFGAHGYNVRSRVSGTTTWSESHASAHRFDTTWTAGGITWEYQVRTDNGDQKSGWSPVVSAVAAPETAPPPVGIVTRSTTTGVDLVWGAPTGPNTGTIDRYQIITLDKDVPGAWIGGTAVKGTSAHIDGLLPGHRYSIAVVTWNAAGGGLPGPARPITVGAGTPPAPTGLRVTATDDTTVQLNWSGSNSAAGYRVWVRNITNGSRSAADENIIEGLSHGVAYLFPGVWNYEFCVTAINGALESGKSNCVVAPRS
ncbi:NPP1 family protein [Micromonospora zamorensis]|uniref:NPP1 family protein n=1 Tax=Micromonospora zamorensis TaxID=709883 RepID=UPI0037B4F968